MGDAPAPAPAAPAASAFSGFLATALHVGAMVVGLGITALGAWQAANQIPWGAQLLATGGALVVFGVHSYHWSTQLMSMLPGVSKVLGYAKDVEPFLPGSIKTIASIGIDDLSAIIAAVQQAQGAGAPPVDPAAVALALAKAVAAKAGAGAGPSTPSGA